MALGERIKNVGRAIGVVEAVKWPIDPSLAKQLKSLMGYTGGGAPVEIIFNETTGMFYERNNDGEMFPINDGVFTRIIIQELRNQGLVQTSLVPGVGYSVSPTRAAMNLYIK